MADTHLQRAPGGWSRPQAGWVAGAGARGCLAGPASSGPVPNPSPVPQKCFRCSQTWRCLEGPASTHLDPARHHHRRDQQYHQTRQTAPPGSTSITSHPSILTHPPTHPPTRSLPGWASAVGPREAAGQGQRSERGAMPQHSRDVGGPACTIIHVRLRTTARSISSVPGQNRCV